MATDNAELDRAGREILDRLGVGVGSSSDSAPSFRYDHLNAIYTSKETDGTIYVGNSTAASKREILDKHNIRNVVNCQGPESKNYYERDPEFTYLRFPIGFWRMSSASRSNKGVLRYFQPLWDYLDAHVGAGENVLVHCLAGAHRAGTTGVSIIMKYSHAEASLAIATAKKLRPIIDPSFFSGLLARLDQALAPEREAALAALAAGSSPGAAAGGGDDSGGSGAPPEGK